MTARLRILCFHFRNCLVRWTIYCHSFTWHIFAVDHQKHLAFVVSWLSALCPIFYSPVPAVNHQRDFVDADSRSLDLRDDLRPVVLYGLVYAALLTCWSLDW